MILYIATYQVKDKGLGISYFQCKKDKDAKKAADDFMRESNKIYMKISKMKVYKVGHEMMEI